ncbi:MAG: hypothetical protein ABH845_01310 [Candidatus Omnitrophota bacterium]
MKEGWGILFSFVYVALVLSAAKQAEARGWISSYAVRKWIHLLVGSWILPTFFLFEHWYSAILPPFCFIWVNLYLERKRFFSFEARDQGFGAVYVPISFVLLLTLFWEDPFRAYASIGALSMAWGDAAAALIGKKWGRHTYTLGRTQKSLEGALAMWGGAAAGCIVSFLLFRPLPFRELVIQSAILASVAALLESFAGRGLDNLTVPLGSAWAGVLLFVRM